MIAAIGAPQSSEWALILGVWIVLIVLAAWFFRRRRR